MSVTSFTLLILLVYFVALKAVSYLAYRRSSHSSEDYFLANRDVGLFALVATTAASTFSTGTVVSGPSEFFTMGASYFWIFSFSLLPLTMMPLAIKFWRIGKVKGFITPGEMIGDFYKSKAVQLLTAVVGLLSVLPYAAAQLVAVGKTFETLTEGVVTYNLGVTIAAVAIGLYLYYGGSRAVVWTDAVQGVIFSTLLVVTGVLAVHWAGGWYPMLDNLRVNHPELATFDISYSYFEFVPACLTFFLLPYVWQRMYMARSATMIAKNVAVLPIVFTLLFTVCWVIGTSALTIFPEGLSDGDNVLGAIFSRHAPYFGAFVLVAAFSAGMSTVDSQLLSAGSLFTKDIFVTTRQQTEEEQYLNARTITVVTMVAIYFWSLTLQDRSIMSLILMGISLTGVLAPCVFGMFYWKRSSALAAVASLLAGLGFFVLKEFFAVSVPLPGPFGSAMWALIASVASFVIVGCFSDARSLNDKREEYREILTHTEKRPVASFSNSVGVAA